MKRLDKKKNFPIIKKGNGGSTCAGKLVAHIPIDKKKADIYLYENQRFMYKRGSVLRSQILRRIISKVIASLG